MHRRIGKINTIRPFRKVANDNGHGSRDDVKRETVFQDIFDSQMWIAKEYKDSEKNKMSSEFFASGPGSTLDRVQVLQPSNVTMYTCGS